MTQYVSKRVSKKPYSWTHSGTLVWDISKNIPLISNLPARIGQVFRSLDDETKLFVAIGTATNVKADQVSRIIPHKIEGAQAFAPESIKEIYELGLKNCSADEISSVRFLERNLASYTSDGNVRITKTIPQFLRVNIVAGKEVKNKQGKEIGWNVEYEDDLVGNYTLLYNDVIEDFTISVNQDPDDDSVRLRHSQCILLIIPFDLPPPPPKEEEKTKEKTKEEETIEETEEQQESDKKEEQKEEFVPQQTQTKIRVNGILILGPIPQVNKDEEEKKEYEELLKPRDRKAEKPEKDGGKGKK